ncbi:MAG: MM0924 family protein [Acidobacteriota bacterium]
MEELLKRCVGKKIDVTCSSNAVYRGHVIGIEGGILEIKDDDDKTIYIASDKITVVYECSDSATRPGFIS